VVVAIIQLRTLKAEVEKGSAAMAISCRLVDPKQQIKIGGSDTEMYLFAKGKKVEILLPGSQVSNCGNTALLEKLTIVPGEDYLSFITPQWAMEWIQSEIWLKRSAKEPISF